MSRRSYMSLYDSDSDDASNCLLENVKNNVSYTEVSKLSGERTVVIQSDSSYQSDNMDVGNKSPKPTGTSSHSPAIGYEEFFRDTVPCITCRGSGRIHKDEEKKLVAIIPLTDKRLKPRRTCIYIILTVFLCVLTGALLLFFLIPRSVEVQSNSPMLYPSVRTIKLKPSPHTKLVVTTCYNFTNNNYYSIHLVGMAVTTNIKRDLRQVGQGSNTTHYGVSSHTLFEYCADVRILFMDDESYITYLCQSQLPYEHIIAMEFKLNANYTVLGQSLQTTLSTFQYVNCGNATRPNTSPGTAVPLNPSDLPP